MTVQRLEDIQAFLFNVNQLMTSLSQLVNCLIESKIQPDIRKGGKKTIKRSHNDDISSHTEALTTKEKPTTVREMSSP